MSESENEGLKKDNMLRAAAAPLILLLGYLSIKHIGNKAKPRYISQNPSKSTNVAVLYPDIIPIDMLKQANEDRELSGYVHPNAAITRAGIYYRNELVGFMTPRLESIEDQAWRTGAIYVLPELRGRNIATKAINSFFKTRRAAPVPIGVGNKASQRAFEKAGFATDGITKEMDGWSYQWWYKKQ